MAKEQPIEIFMPPNVLKAKVGGSGALDLAAIARAEQAIDNLKVEFADWIVDDVKKLDNARATYASKQNEDTLGALYRAAHDLRGQATTFEYPLVARMAKSLCKLTDDSGTTAQLPMLLVDAHVNAIKIVVKQGIKDASDKMAGLLASELEAKVDVFLEKIGAASAA